MEKLARETESATGRIGEAERELAAETGRLGTVSGEALDKARNAAEVLARQAGALHKTAQDTVRQTELLRQGEGRARRDLFLTSAKFVVESLHSLSVDLTRQIDGSVSEKSWKSYQKGNTSVFTRELVENAARLPMDRLKEKYQNDTEFRTYVGRYIRSFEEVAEQAAESDHGDLLAATFQSSDSGRLYQILCKLAGKAPLGVMGEGKAAA